MNPDPDLTIVLLGKTGVGKSASGNTILGRTAFESKLAFKSVTKRIREEREEVFGKQISVVDTPGILDTESTEEEVKMFCQQLLRSCRRCLFLLVIGVGRFTKEDLKAVRTAIEVLGDQGMKHSYLLFTGGDALKGMTLEDFIFQDDEGPLPDVVQMFEKAYHLFNNEDDDEDQVRELLLKSGHLRTQNHPDPPADVSRNRRIVLIGLPGGGKSSSGNTILGSQRFTSGCDFNSVSTKTVSGSATVGGRQVTVVDTPGVTDKVLSPRHLCLEIQKSILEANPGPHAFVIVVRLGRISAADVMLFELLPKLFGRDALQYSMVLFTHGDQLGGRSVEDLIRSNIHVKNLVSMCGGRFCVFNNKASRSREQVRDFLHQIDEMVTANGGRHLINDMVKMAWKLKVWEEFKSYLLLEKGFLATVAALVAVVAVGAVAGAVVGAAAGVGAGVGALAGGVGTAVAGVAGVAGVNALFRAGVGSGEGGDYREGGEGSGCTSSLLVHKKKN